PIVNVFYNLPGTGAPSFSFDLGLILGEADVVDAGDRVEVFSSLTEMVDAGFTSGMAEYLAAQRYFAASSRPSQVALGRILSGETPLAALQACRAANTAWYACYVPSAGELDHI